MRSFIANLSPGSWRCSKWWYGEDPETRCKIVQEQWGISPLKTFHFRVRFIFFLDQNMACSLALIKSAFWSAETRRLFSCGLHPNVKLAFSLASRSFDSIKIH